MNPLSYFKTICKEPSKIDKKIAGKQFLLGKYYDLKKCKKCKDKKFVKSKRQKLLSIQSKIQEQNGKIKQDIEKQKKSQNIKTYNYYLPLHNLWKAYIKDLLEFQFTFILLNLRKNEQSAGLKLLRSDFVGARIEIVYSKIQSYIGHKGIIIKENLRSFVMINQEKENIVTLLKGQIIFSIQTYEKHYLVNGNTLVYRPSDRSKHKFKSKNAQKLNINFLATLMKGNQDREYQNDA